MALDILVLRIKQDQHNYFWNKSTFYRFIHSIVERYSYKKQLSISINSYAYIVYIYIILANVRNNTKKISHN